MVMCGHQRTTRILRDPMNQRASDMPALAPLSVVAKVTGLAVPTVYRAVKRGEIPLAPIGGRKRVRVRDLETLIGRRLTPADFARTPPTVNSGRTRKPR